MTIWILLGLAVCGEVGCVAGVLLAPGPLARLHYAAAGSIVGPLPVAVAVLVDESFTQPAINALLIAGVLLVLGPLLAVETARAIRRGEGR
jgi:multisubunit Na+/H+ antiporter MnhG subunit